MIRNDLRNIAIIAVSYTHLGFAGVIFDRSRSVDGCVCGVCLQGTERAHAQG